MKTNKALFRLLLLTVVGCLLLYFQLHTKNVSSGFRSGERLSQLNQMRGLPTNASAVDRQLAQGTIWWGKPLEPKVFWKGRTIWMDSNALLAANKLGRLYPPIPFGETNFSLFSENDLTERAGGSEGDSTIYHLNYREKVFWGDFDRTHPLPPQELEQKQLEIEREILDSKNIKGFEVNQNVIKGYLNSLKSDAIGLNYPTEALTDDALHWAYLVHQNQQYQHDIQTMPVDLVQAEAQLSDADLTSITNSLSPAQIESANSWKIAYLARLKRQNVDQSYISAYLQAWNLSVDQVFNTNN